MEFESINPIADSTPLVHDGIILPKTTKARNRLFASNFAAKRRNDIAMKRTAANKERVKKSEIRAEIKAQKEAQREKQKIKKTTESQVSAAAARKALDEADEIALKEAAYNEHYVKNANSDLYKLLQIIMAFVEKIVSSQHEEIIKGNMRHALKHSYHIGTQANTPTSSIVVRYITRTSRKNACVYSRVINKAMEDGITSKDLIKYIEENNGIDKIRAQTMSKKDGGAVPIDGEELENKKFLAKFGESYLLNRASSGNVMTKFKLDPKYSNTLIDATRFSTFKYFACEYVNGEYVIVDVVPVDPEFEPVLLERISSFRLQCSCHSQEVADAMDKAAKENGRTFKKPLYISKH